MGPTCSTYQTPPSISLVTTLVETGMLAQRLEETEKKLQFANSRIAQFGQSLSAEDIVAEDVPEFHNQTLYQLDQKYRETDLAAQHLQLLWIIKNLVHELQVAFDPLEEGSYSCDITELQGILQNIKSLKGKIGPFVKDNFIIGSTLQESYEGIIESFQKQLDSLFAKHIRQEEGTFRVLTSMEINQQVHLLKEFFDVVSDFESFTGENSITDKLNEFKPKWDKKLLDPLVNKKKYLLLLPELDHDYSIELADALPPNQFLSSYYFESVRNFVTFINLLENQSFKNYYLTKISNNIVNTISESIEVFLQNRDLLSDDLVKTIALASESGWNVHIAKSLGSLDQINSSISRLHNEWVTDKYINALRLYFNGTEFTEDLRDLSEVEVETVHEPAPIPQSAPIPEPKPEPQPVEADDDWDQPVEADDDWDQPWGSEEEEQGDDDGWDEDWDDSWDDEEKPASPVKPKRQQPPVPKTQPKPEPQQPQPIVSVDVVTRSAVVKSLRSIVEAYLTETGLETAADILFAASEFALMSYPQLHELFLLYNDLRALEFEETTQFAESQWKHTRIQLFGQLNALFTSIDFSNDDAGDDATEDSTGITSAITQFKDCLDQLVDSDLTKTNRALLRNTVCDLSNHANTWVVNGIVSSKEISEFQCEKFTRVLESLDEVEAAVLAKVGSESNRLATYNKLKQAILLVNNHLNDIMEHFYQGDFFDFSTEELVLVLKSVLIQSDLRERCILEILEVRTAD